MEALDRYGSFLSAFYIGYKLFEQDVFAENYRRSSIYYFGYSLLALGIVLIIIIINDTIIVFETDLTEATISSLALVQVTSVVRRRDLCFDIVEDEHNIE